MKLPQDKVYISTECGSGPVDISQCVPNVEVLPGLRAIYLVACTFRQSFLESCIMLGIVVTEII